MATIRNPSMEPVPLLGGGNDGNRRVARRPILQSAARFLRRASSRRMLRQPTLLLRERGAESDRASSRPVVFDILWNLSFVAVAAGVLIMSQDESPEMPLRLWVVGYAVQCVLHMVCVCLEYGKRVRVMRAQLGLGVGEGSSSVGGGSRGSLEADLRGMLKLGCLMGGMTTMRIARESYMGHVICNVVCYYVFEAKESAVACFLAAWKLHLVFSHHTSTAKHLESANTMFSLIWWIIGFYWVSAGGNSLTNDAPQLYWLCIVFLAFDVFFVVFCVLLACLIGLTVCCCLPCLIAILYAVADQGGASDEDIRQLPKYKFRRMGDREKFASEMSGPCGGIMTECGSDPPIEHVLSAEDAECCICITIYDEGVELRELPCSHHFHCSCIDKWLYINATCPLCKYNVVKSSNHGREEV